MQKILVFSILLSLTISSLAKAEILRLSVASTAEETGLITYLIENYKSENPDTDIHLSITGGLNALDNGRNGTADAILTHAPEIEKRFMDDGYGLNRALIMYNQLAIFGPVNDPLGIRKMHKLEDILRILAKNEVEFFAQGEKSATYQKLKYLWKIAGISPEWLGYEHTNSSSLSTLTMSAEFNGYTLADMSTYISLREKISSKVIPLFRDHELLNNYYSYIIVNPEKVDGINHALARDFLEFLTSTETQNLIREYKGNTLPVALFVPAAHLDKSLQADRELQQQNRISIIIIVSLGFILMFSIAVYYFYLRSRKMQILANKSDERYKLAITGTEEGVFDWNITERTLFCSDKMYDLLETAKSADNDFIRMISQHLDVVTSTDFSVKLNKYINELPPSAFEFTFKLDSKDEKWLHIRANISTNTEGTSVRLSGTLTNISELYNKTIELEHQALHDSLTNLPNRKLLNTSLDHAIAESIRYKTRFSLLLIDLNRFKYINDTLGHDVGDELIKEVAKKLTSLSRSSDIVARLGGDEFAIMLPYITHDKTINVCEKIVTSFQEPFRVQGKPLLISGAIGCVFFPDHGENRETLLKHAEIAMYQCKGLNQPVVIYDPDLDPYSERNIVLESSLSSAIDSHELELYYQPVIRIDTNNIIGAEALIRWNHPELGLVFPDEIIPLAERTGLIKNLTYYVIHEAAQQYNKWSASGMTIRIAINLSTWDLSDPVFPDFVESVLNEKKLPGSALEFEITESAMMIEPEKTVETLKKLKAMGFSLSIDDYGTGFSSLSYLSKLPVNTLKIDKSFIMNMKTSAENHTIVRSTIELAHQLGLSATAEGIEDKEILTILNKLHCDLGQGYYISRPIPAGDFADWVKNSSWTI